jgi:hypothetical protein
MIDKKGVPDSEFYMWRAVFAFAFADNILSLEEQDVLRSYINSVEFSKMQLSIIQEDFRHPPNVVNLHRKITRQQDRERFCVLARTLVWCDGDMDRQEAEILKRVSCIKDNDAYMEALRSSRTAAPDFYENYARASVAGLFKMPPNVEMRV